MFARTGYRKALAGVRRLHAGRSFLMKGVRQTDFAYQAVYRYLTSLISEVGTDDARVKLPSLRQLADRLNVSISTMQYGLFTAGEGGAGLFGRQVRLLCITGVLQQFLQQWQ